MRVFVTGATGFIGGVIVPELLRAGHQVLGLSRSDAGDRALDAMGAEAHRGQLEDLDSLRRGAARADGVIHAGFIHDFSKFAENCAIDGRAIDAIGQELAGSQRPLVVTAGIPSLPERITTEVDDVPTDHPTPRVSEQKALALAARGVHASVVRLPQVHDRDKAGLVPYLIAVAQQKGVSAYVGEGSNRWSAVHRFDTAPLYRLVLENGSAGARYHAVAEEGVAMKDIAEAIGRGLKIPAVSMSPQEAAAHFGALALFSTMSNPASSAITRERLHWAPGEHPGLIDDLENATAFTV
ncbi:MAG: SDR family oxidoreductase [Vitreoscilla sp.]